MSASPGSRPSRTGETQIEERSGGVVVVDPLNQTLWAKDGLPVLQRTNSASDDHQ